MLHMVNNGRGGSRGRGGRGNTGRGGGGGVRCHWAHCFFVAKSKQDMESHIRQEHQPSLKITVMLAKKKPLGGGLWAYEEEKMELTIPRAISEENSSVSKWSCFFNSECDKEFESTSGLIQHLQKKCVKRHNEGVLAWVDEENRKRSSTIQLARGRTSLLAANLNFQSHLPSQDGLGLRLGLDQHPSASASSSRVPVSGLGSSAFTSNVASAGGDGTHGRYGLASLGSQETNLASISATASASFTSGTYTSSSSVSVGGGQRGGDTGGFSGDSGRQQGGGRGRSAGRRRRDWEEASSGEEDCIVGGGRGDGGGRSSCGSGMRARDIAGGKVGNPADAGRRLSPPSMLPSGVSRNHSPAGLTSSSRSTNRAGVGRGGAFTRSGRGGDGPALGERLVSS